MKPFPISKRGLLLAISGVVALLVVACGGGGADQDAAVQEAERAHALGLLEKLPVSWKPNAITFNANPGFRQDVPVTLTTTKALTNAKIVFVPDLRNAVTVIPDTIPALAAGQSATVTLRFAPAATDTRKVIAGIALLYDKSTTTISQPLPVKVTLVAPETINGVAVPPEPPPDLNNATLAGFDTNGNGVRDDVERYIVQAYPASAKARASLFQVARASLEAISAADHDDQSGAIAADRRSVAGETCVYFVFGLSNGSRMVNSLLAKEVNTVPRARADARLQGLLGGQGYSIPADKKAQCETNPDTLPN